MSPEHKPESPEVSFPKFIEVVDPIKLTETNNPRDIEKWVYEYKLNGFRGVVIIQNGTTRIFTVGRLHKPNTEVTLNLPELTPAFKTIGEEHSSVILDGEIVAGHGKTDEERYILSSRVNSRKPSLNPRRRVNFVPFDILHLDGKDLKHIQLLERKKILNSVFSQQFRRRFGIRPALVRSTNFLSFIAQAAYEGYEGVVLKRKDGQYIPGRTRWLKHRYSSDELRYAREFLDSVTPNRLKQIGKLHL